MTIEMFLLLIALASIATFLVILSGTSGTIAGLTVDRRLGIVVSGVALMLWGLVAINSFEITVFSGGEEFTRSYEQMAWVATAGGAIAIYSLFQATIQEIRDTGGI